MTVGDIAMWLMGGMITGLLVLIIILTIWLGPSRLPRMSTTLPPPELKSKNNLTAKKMNTEIFTDLLHATPEELSFVATYINQLQNLAECKKILSPESGASAKFKDECTIRLRNLDLWADAHKLKYPLTAFRLKVAQVMREVGVSVYPDFIYEKENHFKQ